MLDECVRSLDEPFRRSEILGWFRRHYPDVNERSISPHIQGATSNAPGGVQYDRPALLTRIDHGKYVRYRNENGVASDTRDNSRFEPTLRTVEGHDLLTEACVQARLVGYLRDEGWTIVSEADTVSRQRGTDIVATRGSRTLGIEVKGYPGRTYADPRRAGEKKTTQPGVQAGHYFAGAILSAMQQKSRQPEMLSVIAFPDVPRYRKLAAEVASSLAAAGIGLWLIDEHDIVDVIVDIDY